MSKQSPGDPVECPITRGDVLTQYVVVNRMDLYHALVEQLTLEELRLTLLSVVLDLAAATDR